MEEVEVSFLLRKKKPEEAERSSSSAKVTKHSRKLPIEDAARPRLVNVGEGVRVNLFSRRLPSLFECTES